MVPFTARLRRLKLSVLALITLAMMLTGLTSVQAQNCYVNPRIKKITANISTTIQSYLEFKPVDYATAPNKKYALLVYLGGTGEMFQQPGGSDQDLCPVLQYSMPWRMNVGHFPDVVRDSAGREYSYLVVMPFVTAWEQQYAVNPGAVIDYMIQAYPGRIDTNRIYLTGMSRGTDNIMGYITSSASAASKVTAVVPVANCFPANVGTSFYNTQVANMAAGKLRLWGISCQGDKPCPEIYMKNWVKSLDSLRPGYSLFTNASLDCVGPDSSFHYAWNHAYNPDYRAAPGNKNIYEWLIQFSKGTGTGGGTPPAPPANCSTLVISPAASAIKVKGLIAPVATVHIFNSSWATVYNQTFTNSPDSIFVPNLPSGSYFVKINFYTSSWTSICEKTQNVTVTTTGDNPPPPPPPPPPPAGGCSNVTATTGSGQIRLSGLVAPVIGVQVFNSSWATVYNRTFTNSPNNLTISPLANGKYNVKVTFYTSSWAYTCDKMIEVTVGAAGAIEGQRSGDVTVLEQEDMFTLSTGKKITVAPNPSRGPVNVVIGSNKNENATIMIMDMSGRILVRKAIGLQRGVNRFTFDELNSYPPGSYFLRLATSSEVENVRLIRQ
jgi:hypothetical protein